MLRLRNIFNVNCSHFYHVVLLLIINIFFTSSISYATFCDGDHAKQQQLGSIVLGSNYTEISFGYLCQYSYTLNELQAMDLPTYHTGIDYPANPNTTLYAAVSGTLYKGNTVSFGYSLVLVPDSSINGNVDRIIYLHLQKPDDPTNPYYSKLNQHVNQGEAIGKVYDDHLHIELRKNYYGFFAVGRESCNDGECNTKLESAGLTVDPGELVSITTESTRFMDFEDGTDHAVIRSKIPGLVFSTTQGYDWIYADWRTGEYNGPYPNGSYYSNGNFCAWLGENQGTGRIDFTGSTARSLSVWTSTTSGLIMDAYDSNNKLIATSGWATKNTDTGKMTKLAVSASSMSYVLIHDSGNYWLIDDLEVSDLLSDTRVYLPDNYKPQYEDLNTTNQGDSKWSTFFNNIRQNIKFILGWGGSELSIRAYDPDGNLYDARQSDTPPIVLDILDAKPGEWQFEVSAIDVPHDNYPYAIVVGLPDSDGDGVADQDDNCPDIPNPDQYDTDGDNVGDVCDSCTDIDKDGYAVEGDICGLIDCNDNDSSINPAKTEGPFGSLTCSDGIDNDCDNLIDGNDTSCSSGPELAVTYIGNLPASKKRGSSFYLKTTVKNEGVAKAGRFIVRYYLSLDTIKDDSDILLKGSRTLKKIKDGKSSNGKTKVTIKKSTPPGEYYLIVCADDTNKVSESNEMDNCSASQTTINVK